MIRGDEREPRGQRLSPGQRIEETGRLPGCRRAMQAWRARLSERPAVIQRNGEPDMKRVIRAVVEERGLVLDRLARVARRAEEIDSDLRRPRHLDRTRGGVVAGVGIGSRAADPGLHPEVGITGRKGQRERPPGQWIDRPERKLELLSTRRRREDRHVLREVRPVVPHGSGDRRPRQGHARRKCNVEGQVRVRGGHGSGRPEGEGQGAHP